MEFKEYTNGRRTIKATQTMFELLYKDLGFKPVKAGAKNDRSRGNNKSDESRDNKSKSDKPKSDEARSDSSNNTEDTDIGVFETTEYGGAPVLD